MNAFRAEVRWEYASQYTSKESEGSEAVTKTKDVCNLESLELCKSKTCRKNTDLCSKIHGASVSLRAETVCSIQHGFQPPTVHQLGLSSPNHPFGQCSKMTKERYFTYVEKPKDATTGSDSTRVKVCWCKDEMKYGANCNMDSAIFARTFSPSVLPDLRNEFGYKDSEGKHAFTSYQEKLNKNLKELEKSMTLTVGEACDSNLNEKSKFTIVDFFGNIPSLDLYQTSENDHKKYLISDFSKITDLEKYVSEINGKNLKLCNFKRFQFCQSNKCTQDQLPLGIVPVLGEDGNFAYAAGQTGCDTEVKANSLPRVFGSFKNKCVPHAICSKDCKADSKASKSCLCTSDYKKEGHYCVKKSKSEGAKDPCSDYYLLEIKQLEEVLEQRQTLGIGQICHITEAAGIKSLMAIGNDGDYHERLLLLRDGLIKNKELEGFYLCKYSDFLQCRDGDPELLLGTACGFFDDSESLVVDNKYVLSKGSRLISKYLVFDNFL
jgi:hypothetical protein